ncbi:unnamed protein product [Phytomonas sp. Hart1]|nr:unnamed protein product [Phytomonas sp. Hart1]|eukprot:CCW66715.1 unnamed protein product [Phytomonas sp. isolate Hart1]
MSFVALDRAFRTVDDVLQYLKGYRHEHMSDAFLSNNSLPEAYKFLQTLGLGLSPLSEKALLPEDHRIQFSIRGQRFEMPPSIALKYYLVFFLFFSLPFQSEGSPDAEAGNVKSIPLTTERKTADTSGSIAQLVGSKGFGLSAHFLLLSAEHLTTVLTRHYQETVWPCLVKILNLLCCDNPSINFMDHNGGYSSTMHDSAVDNFQLLFPVSMAEVVSWDGAMQHWRFEFLNRLPDDVEKAEKERLNLFRGCKRGSIGCCSENAVASRTLVNLIPNDNPLLLLQPHYVGTILVYIRRLNQAFAGDKARRRSVLAIRWGELDYDQQLCVSQVVRALGVVPLITTNSVPIAPITTSQYISRSTEVPTGNGTRGCSNPQGGQSLVSQPTIASNVTLESEEDWIRQGCLKCGISGHSTVECPY